MSTTPSAPAPATHLVVHPPGASAAHRRFNWLQFALAAAVVSGGAYSTRAAWRPTVTAVRERMAAWLPSATAAPAPAPAPALALEDKQQIVTELREAVAADFQREVRSQRLISSPCSLLYIVHA